jgi:hypothetical protein
MTFPIFAAGDVLRATDMNSVSSWKLVDTDFTTSTLVEVENVFSADYDHYEVILYYWGSAASATQLRFHTSTSTPTTATDYFRYGFYLTPAGGFNNFQQNSVNESFVDNHGTTAGVMSSARLLIVNPFTNNTRTHIYDKAFDAQGGLLIDIFTQWANNTRFTGFRIYPSGGNITGNIQVRGWRA